jgi:hypothetical protein
MECAHGVYGDHYGHNGKWREMKKFFRKQGMSHPVEAAFNLGGYMGDQYGVPEVPPLLRRYPPGLRRAAFESAYKQAREDRAHAHRGW